MLVLAVIPQIMADTAGLQIVSQGRKDVPFTLNAGDSASGTLVMNGGVAVDFWISDPQDRNVTVYSRIGTAQFSFDAQTSGSFQFHVFNPNTETALGTLNYTLVHRIFGMPQEILLLLVIVGILLLMLIAWAATSKV